MTNKTRTKDPRPWHAGKALKKIKSTNRFLRRKIKDALRKGKEI